MSSIFGILNLSDVDNALVSTVGQKVVYDAIQQFMAEQNAALAEAKSFFVSNTTEDFKFRYMLPGGGYLQKRGGQAPSGAVKGYGNWDVSLPLEDFGAQFGGDDITLAYMSLQTLNTHLQTVFVQNINTIRLEIMKALLDNVQYVFPDPVQGNLTVVPLANGDAVIYPPPAGSETEAVENHYLESGYASSGISDVNNPFAVVRADLIQHSGGPQQGGESLVAIINSAQTPKVSALTNFVGMTDGYIVPGSASQSLINVPKDLPGRIIGRCDGVWVAEWDWVPAEYLYAQNVDAPAPLQERVDPAATGLPRGLTLVAKDEYYPLQSSHYRNRFGFGVANRLNGVVMKFAASGGYTVPSGFSHS
jgi:hypothetical protein